MAYTLGVPDLGGNLQFSAVQAAEQARQQQAALELRALQQAQEQQQALSLEAYRRAALAQQGANAQRNDQLALADLRLRAQQADRANAAQEQAAAQDAAANARVGTMTDLGHGYRAVLVGPRSAQVIEPERQPWRPDPETLRSLQTAGYLYAPQSERGGSFVPVSTKPAGPPLGTTTDLGAGFRGVVTGPGRMTVVRPERTPKALSSNDAAELKVLDNQIAETEKTVAQYGAGKPDQRTGFLGLFGNTNAEATQAAAAKVEELKSKRTALLSRAGRTVESPTPTPAPAQTPAPDATPAPSPAPAAPAAPSAPSAKTTPQNDTILASARAAIAKGAPREAVIARLQAAGIDPTGL